MAEVKVYYDRAGNTLTVWSGNSQDEFICEETGDEVVLMKDKSGRVIGFEKLNFLSLDPALPHLNQCGLLLKQRMFEDGKPMNEP